MFCHWRLMILNLGIVEVGEVVDPLHLLVLLEFLSPLVHPWVDSS